MRLITESAEGELIELVFRLRQMPIGWQAWHFHLSSLPEALSPTNQESLLTRMYNLLRDERRSPHNQEGIFVCCDKDIIALVYHRPPELLSRLEQVLRTFRPNASPEHKTQRPLPSHDAFCSQYDLTDRYEELFLVCARKEYLASQMHNNSADSASTAVPANDRRVFESAMKRRGMRDTLLILIVEDDQFTVSMLHTMLKAQYQTLSASNGVEALQSYYQEAPDMVFLDIELPDTSGHRILSSIAALDPNHFVIMLSAHREIDNVKKASASGARGYITKPFSRDKIDGYLQICLAEREEARRQTSAESSQDGHHG